MKIAMLSTFYPYRGGIAQFSASLFRALEKNHEIKAFNFSKQYPSFLFPGQTQFVRPEDNADEIPSERLLNSLGPFSYLKTANAINRFAPELLISNYWMTFFGPSMGTVAKKMKPGTKRVALLHNVVPHEKRFFDDPANRYFLKNHDGFVVLSDVVEKDLLQLKPDAKILKVGHPVYDHFGEKMDQLEAKAKLKLDPSKKTLLFFGIIRDYKGLDVLIDAFASLDDSFQLIVAGEVYGSFEKYEKQIEDHQLKDRVHIFNQYIDDNEVSPFFSAADVCILPYKSATQSGITGIANHFDLPIIATDVGGLKETITDGKTGLIVKRPESGLIAQTISAYFEGDKKSVFAANIREEKKENSWENFARKLIGFYEELAK